MDELAAAKRSVVGTTFNLFPSYPQRYTQVLDPQPESTPDELPR